MKKGKNKNKQKINIAQVNIMKKQNITKNKEKLLEYSQNSYRNHSEDEKRTKSK